VVDVISAGTRPAVDMTVIDDPVLTLSLWNPKKPDIPKAQ
jgi:hypothetical protein